MSEIGKRLKFAREAIGYTPRKAARLSKMDVDTLLKYENELLPVTFKHLSRLAELYKRNLEFFIQEGPIPKDPLFLWCK